MFYPVDRTTGTREIKGCSYTDSEACQCEYDHMTRLVICNRRHEAVIIDARGIDTIVTARAWFMIYIQNIKSGIKLFLTEHPEILDDHLQLWSGSRCSKTTPVPHIYQALKSVGINSLYELCDCEGDVCYISINAWLEAFRLLSLNVRQIARS